MIRFPSRPGRYVNPDIETDKEEVAPTPSQAQEPELRRSSRKRVPPKVLNLCTTTEVEYDQAEYALITGIIV